MLGDRTCVPVLMSFLANGSEVAQAESGGVNLPQPYNAILEALGMLGATEAIPLIEPFSSHPVEMLQYAAARAMYELTQDSAYAERLVQALSGEKLPLRRAVLADLGAIGYLPAAEAIVQTLAENSLKLIALKGLLEKQILQTTPPSLSDGAIHVIALMDNLL
jgi:phycocyanobilin lyase alpha subunit